QPTQAPLSANDMASRALAPRRGCPAEIGANRLASIAVSCCVKADLRRSSGPDRRKFLVFAGLALAVGGGAVVAVEHARGGHRSPGAGSSPSGPAPRQPASGAPGTSPVAVHRSPAVADWAALRRELSAGQLVLPEDSGYDRARLLFDPKFDSVRPAAVAYCAVPGEVSACIGFARKFGVPLAVRSGGHSYGGWSTT